jgi:hypothetical protein
MLHLLRDRTALPPITDRRTLAIEIFNRSDEAETVLRLIRMLGLPRVSIGAAAGSGAEFRLTVVWELSCYQWAIDPDDEVEPVRELIGGGDPAELDPPAQQWNAHARRDGSIALGYAAAAA